MLHERLRVYKESVQLAEGLSKEGATWPRGFGYLLDQLRRAMASVVLNTAEGNARKSRCERRRFFEIARASVAEVAACLDLGCAFGIMKRVQTDSYKSQLSHVSRMLWGLIR